MGASSSGLTLANRGGVERRAIRFRVSGPPGAGKTALVNRLAHDVARPGAAERSFPSGGALAAAVRDLPAPTAGNARRSFVHADRAFVLDDGPASDAPDGVLVVVDAVTGLTDAAAAALVRAADAGLSAVVAVNKLDRVGFEYEVFKAIRAQVSGHAHRFGPGGIVTVPVSAWHGFNVVAPGEALEWHPDRTLLESLVAVADHGAARTAALA